MFEPELRALAEAAERVTRTPDFGSLLRRGRRRRRQRRAAGGFACLAVAVGAVLVAITVSGSPRSSEPVQPGPTQRTEQHQTTPNQPPSRRYLLRHPVALVNQPAAQLADVSYADPDHAAAVWQVCSAADMYGVCPEALTWTSDGWLTSHAMVIPDKLQIYALPDGSTVVWLYGPKSFVVRPDGSTGRLRIAHRSLAAAPGASLVNLVISGGERAAGILDVRTRIVYPPLTAPSTRCYIEDRWDGRGRIWEYGIPRCGHGTPTFAWSDDLGRTWSTHPTGPGSILGIAATPARTAVLIGDAAGLSHLDITTDGGNTWTRVRLPDDVILAPYSIATTSSGELLLADGSYLWAANDDWTAFDKVDPDHLTAITSVATGDQVIAVTGNLPDKILISTDGGQSWQMVEPRP